MSTNYYWIIPADRVLPTGVRLPARIASRDYDPRVHIGLAALGPMYCWRCRAAEVEDEHGPCGAWYTITRRYRCRRCGAERPWGSPAPPPFRGISAAGRFIWAQKPRRVVAALMRDAGREIVVDDYDRGHRGVALLEMLRHYPVAELRVGERFC